MRMRMRMRQFFSWIGCSICCWYCCCWNDTWLRIGKRALELEHRILPVVESLSWPANKIYNKHHQRQRFPFSSVCTTSISTPTGALIWSKSVLTLFGQKREKSVAATDQNEEDEKPPTPPPQSLPRTLTIPSISQQKKDRNENKSRNNDDNNNDRDRLASTSVLTDGKFLERNKHWIIFVDDEEAIRNSVGDFLYDSGYQITACADATAVVEVCRAAAKPSNSESSSLSPSPSPLPKLPACIVSDIRMPGGPDGLELLQWIRSNDLFQRVPVILLTAKGLTDDRIAGYKAGADVYLSKPFYPNELLSAIDNVIQRRQQMTSTAGGALLDLQQEMANLKLLLVQNSRRTVAQTSVYLTLAEREILDLLCRGYTNAEIATERGTSKPYVTKTLGKLYKETGTATRTELLKWAVQTGYVSPRIEDE